MGHENELSIPEKNLKLFFIAGEASGDLHGKNLLKALNQICAERAISTAFVGFGGDGMQTEGMRIVRHIRETNFMGFSEVLKNLRKIRALFREVKAAILEFRPDAVVLIDYPGFNLRMAKWLKENGIPVLYYISPQVWAWKKGRVATIRKYVDRMFVILPFEKEFYRKENYEVEFVGHPLLDEMNSRTYSDSDFRRHAGLDGRPLLALLPGSRRQELLIKLPVMLAAAKQFPEWLPVVAAAPGLEAEIQKIAPGTKMVSGQTYDLLHAASFALVTSGTATLETALMNVPQIVCYAGNPLSVLLARRLIRVPFISLVNLVAGREVVKELIQQEMNVKMMAGQLRRMRDDHQALAGIFAGYAEIRHKLGNSGASKKCAEGILKQVFGK